MLKLDPEDAVSEDELREKHKNNSATAETSNNQPLNNPNEEVSAQKTAEPNRTADNVIKKSDDVNAGSIMVRKNNFSSFSVVYFYRFLTNFCAIRIGWKEI